jgi:hypothetical protein
MGYYPQDRRVAYRHLDTYIIFRLLNDVGLRMVVKSFPANSSGLACVPHKCYKTAT